MDFNQFITWLFYGILGGSALYGVNILTKLKDSVEALNISVATVIEKTSWHEKVLDRHEKELDNLRNKGE